MRNNIRRNFFFLEMSDDDIPDEEQIRKLLEVDERLNKWASRLNEEENQIRMLESQVEFKELKINELERNLGIIEQRQKQFDQLLTIYEEQSGNVNPELTRSEVLDKAKSLSRNLEKHQKEIKKMNENVTTLKDMIFLISDIHCKFSKLKDEIAPNQTLDEEDFLDPEEEDQMI